MSSDHCPSTPPPAGSVSHGDASGGSSETSTNGVYSRYNLPPGHFLFDETIRWESGKNPEDLPSWSIHLVNGLLEAIASYVTEGAKVLHRDMSGICNVLMRPTWAKLQSSREVYKLEDAPPMIQDVPNGPLEQRTAQALIDTNDPADELMHRTGTPMYYIARSVSLGMVLKDDYVLRAQRMPTLTGKALELYNEDTKTRHGALPPEQESHENTYMPAFTHRPEHDVEFFTLLSALLRLQPLPAPQEKYASRPVAGVWDTHSIPNNPDICDEDRGWILQLNLEHWERHFPPVMKEVARMDVANREADINRLCIIPGTFDY
ncbi:hypothetical protein C8Q74DRAFT_1427850 [Fomes fomentarius]|nr:hypothetical protein C8Q74DRAFT_1427850 [Fomes fomentarius]